MGIIGLVIDLFSSIKHYFFDEKDGWDKTKIFALSLFCLFLTSAIIYGIFTLIS
ncbi:hypothetical protein [Bacillus sp. FJAT-45066]|uniref:hypothetical protein n=1 Tax=Bacillus sp. FJAT-45066 TaxID=2011010 RepID=UPI0015963E6A|nr:hypothetical protein [Bacillus sp. FJAT-45066]